MPLAKIAYHYKDIAKNKQDFADSFHNALAFFKDREIVVCNKTFSPDAYHPIPLEDFKKRNEILLKSITHLLVLGNGKKDPRVKWEIAQVIRRKGIVYYEEIPDTPMLKAASEYLKSKGNVEISYLAGKYNLVEARLREHLAAKVANLSIANANKYYTRRAKGNKGKG
jgi:hypothetical protein